MSSPALDNLLADATSSLAGDRRMKKRALARVPDCASAVCAWIRGAGRKIRDEKRATHTTG